MEEGKSRERDNIPALLNQELASAASATRATETRACNSLMTMFVTSDPELQEKRSKSKQKKLVVEDEECEADSQITLGEFW